MNEISMSTCEIVEHMNKGASLRGSMGRFELRLPDKVVFVPPNFIFSLIDQGQIVSDEGGYYRVAEKA